VACLSGYLARAWAKFGADLRVPAPGQAENGRHVVNQVKARIVHANAEFTSPTPLLLLAFASLDAAHTGRNPTAH
jgi:hypothetical protein